MTAKSAIGFPFIELQQVDSTNNYATASVHARMAQHGAVFFAHHQTAGRGQRGKQWATEPGANLAMSIVLEPAPLVLSEAFLLSRLAACAAARLLMKILGDEVRIKWPNDLYWCDRKAGGILIENIIQGTTWKAAIVGIGININQTLFAPELAGRAVSVKQITGATHSPSQLAKDLCTYLQAAWEELHETPESLKATYHELLYKRNQIVQLRKGAIVFAAKVEGVDDLGRLIIFSATEQRFDVGEIEWIF